MLTKNDLNEIRSIVNDEIETVVAKHLKPVKKDLRWLKKTVDIVARNYDEEDVKLGRRVTKIEKHLGLSS